MAAYNVVPKPSVEKDLRSLPKTVLTRVMKAIEGLGSEPFPRQTTKLEGSNALFRIRVGDYRIIYEVNRAKREVTIHYVRHRRDAYRKL
jgi:mRNA interferase RelE/StbE